MKVGRSLAISLVSVLASALLPGACGSDGLVGGACFKGLTNCSNHCVDLERDADNCGRCAHRCAKGVECIKGLCGGGGEGEGGWGGDNPNGGSGNHGRDGGSGDASVDPDAEPGDAFGEFDVTYPNDGNVGGGGNAGGGGNVGGGNVGGGNVGGSSSNLCVPPFDTAEHCGSCNRTCVNPTRVCAPVEGKFDCVPFCDTPLVECNGSCVDLNSDSENCGQCSRACPSAICQGGDCVGAQAGHIVPICMNFRETAQNSQPTNLLGNAILLPLFNPVKILAYDEFAEPTVRQRVDQTIAWASSARGRGYRITSISQSDAVNQQLMKPDYDIFLVYEQQLAPAGVLSGYGSQWSKTIESFSHVGGVIVVLSGATGIKEMGQFLTSSRLLEVTSESAVSRTQVYNRQPSDAIGSNVVSPFLAPRDSCVFSTNAPSDGLTTFIVTDNPTSVTARRPLAVHRIAMPPVK